MQQIGDDEGPIWLLSRKQTLEQLVFMNSFDMNLGKFGQHSDNLGPSGGLTQPGDAV